MYRDLCGNPLGYSSTSNYPSFNPVLQSTRCLVLKQFFHLTTALVRILIVSHCKQCLSVLAPLLFSHVISFSLVKSALCFVFPLLNSCHLSCIPSSHCDPSIRPLLTFLALLKTPCPCYLGHSCERRSLAMTVFLFFILNVSILRVEIYLTPLASLMVLTLWLLLNKCWSIRRSSPFLCVSFFTVSFLSFLLV